MTNLKKIQKNVVLNLEDNFELSANCPQNLRDYYTLSSETVLQTILWTTYAWEKHQMTDNLNCILLIDNYGQEDQSYTILNTFESQVLLSASQGVGFHEKGFYEYSDRINQSNSDVLLKKEQSIIDKKNLIMPTVKKAIYDDRFENIQFNEKDTDIIFSQNSMAITSDLNEPIHNNNNKSRSTINHTKDQLYP